MWVRRYAVNPLAAMPRTNERAVTFSRPDSRSLSGSSRTQTLVSMKKKPNGPPGMSNCRDGLLDNGYEPDVTKADTELSFLVEIERKSWLVSSR